jgi:hypothetical protein
MNCAATSPTATRSIRSWLGTMTAAISCTPAAFALASPRNSAESCRGISKRFEYPGARLSIYLIMARDDGVKGSDSRQNGRNIRVTWPADPQLLSQNDARVKISYDYALQIPFMSAMTVHLASTSQMLVSQ